MSLIDLTGQQFGRLTVISRDESKPKGHGHKAYWICKCECGNIKSILGENLRLGRTKSCGCLHKDIMKEKLFHDIAGQTFGFIVPLYTTGQTKNGTYIWKCKCLKCGNYKDIISTDLVYGHTRSCGCIGKSSGEALIEDILVKNNIIFQKEYKFKDCVSDKNYSLRFDFAIFKNDKLHCLIEFQGKQHFEHSTFDVYESLEDRQRRDEIKREYCKKNNIILIEITYKDINNLNWNFIKEKCNL